MDIKLKEVEKLLGKYDLKIEEFKNTTELSKKDFLKTKDKVKKVLKIEGIITPILCLLSFLIFSDKALVVFIAALLPEIALLVNDYNDLDIKRISYEKDVKKLKYIIDNKENYEQFIIKSLEDSETIVDDKTLIEESIRLEEEKDKELSKVYTKKLF